MRISFSFWAFLPSFPGILGFGRDKKSFFFFGGFPRCFPKKQGKEGQGRRTAQKKNHVREELKGRSLKGSFDKRMRIDLPVPLPVPNPPPPPSHSLPLFLCFQEKTPPTTTPLNATSNPSPRDSNRNSHPFVKTTPGKNYPLVCARSWQNIDKMSEKCPEIVRTLVARAIRNAIRANRFARIIRNWNPYFYSANRPIRTNHSNFRDSRESRH